MRHIKIITVLTLVMSCGHKAPPLAHDRMKPKLERALALNNRQVQLVFSEPIDTLSLKPDWFTLFNSQETLSIITIYPGLSGAELVAVTSPQSALEYTIQGYALDTAQNKANITAYFTGSTAPDTIAPWFVDYSKGTKQSYFRVIFSEAMDTSSIKYHIIPKKNFSVIWKELRGCELFPATENDSLNFDTTYYLFIDSAGAHDYSGNPAPALITTITPDTSYKSFPLTAAVYLNDTLIDRGYALLKRKILIGITFVKNGKFSFAVRDTGAYQVEVISGAYSGSAQVWPESTNILRLEPEKKNLDSIIN